MGISHLPFDLRPGGQRGKGTVTYYIALGSNLGDRRRNLQEAWKQIASLGRDTLLSSLYETEPLYDADQPLFLNAVGSLSAEMHPRVMLALLHGIEADFGRDRSSQRRMGPRALDLDILLWGDLRFEVEDLTIPHPRIAERRFVLVPMLEIAPQLRDPRTGEPFAAQLERLGGRGGVYSSGPQ